MPIRPEEIAKHREKPHLVREFILGLPEGLSLFYLCSVVLDYPDLDPFVHGTLCDFLVNPKYGRFRCATVPRSFFKTSVATIGKSIWLPLRRDRNIKILIAMNTADNAEKRINVIRHHWTNNKLLQGAFPELVPDFRKVRWSNQCAELNRTRPSDEGTYESVGSGGAVVSRHYDHIDEDDLVFAKKDDLSGAEIQPNKEDINKAVGWHKLVYSLFSDPAHSTLDNIGTRWAPHDLKDWIWKNETHLFKFFRLRAETEQSNPDWAGHGKPIWPNRFSTNVLRDIAQSQGMYMYHTQYLNDPRDPADAAFSLDTIDWFEYNTECLAPFQTRTIVDLALWGDSKGLCRNVILTLRMDKNHHIWVMRYDRGKYDPTQVIELMEAHAKQFKDTKVKVEEVQYQRAIRHFARKRMEETGFFYDLTGLPTDTRSGAKDLRIRNITHIAKMGGMHMKKSQKDLIEEYEDYPSGMTCDILDCIGWGLRLLNPQTQEIGKEPVGVNTLEGILDGLEQKSSKHKYPFSVQCPAYNQPLCFGDD